MQKKKKPQRSLVTRDSYISLITQVSLLGEHVSALLNVSAVRGFSTETFICSAKVNLLHSVRGEQVLDCLILLMSVIHFDSPYF